MITILCKDNSIEREHSTIISGYRGDIYVKINGKYYHLEAYSLNKMQETEAEFEFNGALFPHRRVITPMELTNAGIIQYINNLYSNGFFNYMEVKSDIFIDELMPMSACYG